VNEPEPLQYVWWLVSRAAGIAALGLISLSVVLGLAMSTRALQSPRLRRSAARLHEHLALTALGAITAHGLALLGDRWLRPGWRGIAIPFAMAYRPGFTGVGIIGGYLAVLLGPSFYLRRRIGARRWRKLHRATPAVWLLSVVHALGSGSDAPKLWLRAMTLSPLPLLIYLLVVRLIGARGGAGQKRPIAREVDPERGAIAGRRLRVDAAPVRFSDRARDREAKSTATRVPRTIVSSPVEALEDLL
jgi:sulfoxide reductase heme-binding subunit YedZ